MAASCLASRVDGKGSVARFGLVRDVHGDRRRVEVAQLVGALERLYALVDAEQRRRLEAAERAAGGDGEGEAGRVFRRLEVDDADDVGVAEGVVEALELGATCLEGGGDPVRDIGLLVDLRGPGLWGVADLDQVVRHDGLLGAGWPLRRSLAEHPGVP